jgi:hypothetical protein
MCFLNGRRHKTSRRKNKNREDFIFLCRPFIVALVHYRTQRKDKAIRTFKIMMVQKKATTIVVVQSLLLLVLASSSFHSIEATDGMALVNTAQQQQQQQQWSNHMASSSAAATASSSSSSRRLKQREYSSSSRRLASWSWSNMFCKCLRLAALVFTIGLGPGFCSFFVDER